MEVYVGIAYYHSMEGTNKSIYFGVKSSIAEWIKSYGLDAKYITKQWGGIDKYIEWLNTHSHFHHDNVWQIALGNSKEITDKLGDDTWGWTLNIHQETL